MKTIVTVVLSTTGLTVFLLSPFSNSLLLRLDAIWQRFCGACEYLRRLPKSLRFLRRLDEFSLSDQEEQAYFLLRCTMRPDRIHCGVAAAMHAYLIDTLVEDGMTEYEAASALASLGEKLLSREDWE